MAPKHKKRVEDPCQPLLARKYIETIENREISITNNEIKDKYDKNRVKYYYRVKKDKPVKVIEPVSRVK